ncbi:MAG: hypothetical protein JXR95_03045 [Deltaproteobacteria bacterium]|nr:hypothetical protein [Deltaproteobacteria bacterium]
MYRIIILLAATISITANASTTRQWSFENYGEFRGGKSNGVILPSSGGLLPGLRPEKAVTKEKLPSLFYSMLKAKNGRIFIGSGDEAGIWTLKGDKLSRLVDLKVEVLVTSIIELPNGDIAASAIPNGQIYRITASGKTKILAKLPVDHIWSMVFDGKWIYAGCGPKAEVYKINPTTGKAVKIWSTKEKHVLSLHMDRPGHLLAGTSPKARIYGIPVSGKGNGTLIYDFPGNEVKSISSLNGKIFAAVNNLTFRATVPYSATKRVVKPVKNRASLVASSRKLFHLKKVANGTGSIFIVGQNGEAEQMLGLRSGFFTRVYASGGKIYASDGQNGQIYLLDPKDYSGSVLLETTERQLQDFWLDPGKSGVVITGDGAACYTLKRNAKKEISYESKVMDATRGSRFGRLLLNVTGGKVTVETRTSAVSDAKDDSLWSPWRKPGNFKLLPGGFLSATVNSPGARFFQYRIKWPQGSKARVRGIKVYFVPANLQPRMLDIGFTGAVSYHSGLFKMDPVLPDQLKTRSSDIKILWKYFNPDGDSHLFTIYYRRIGEKTWRKFRSKAPVRGTYFVWKAGNYPDGVYEVKVRVDDSPSNSQKDVKFSELVSGKVVVDNSPPLLTKLKAVKRKVSFTVTDKVSRLTAVSWSISGKTFHMAMPVDGIFDTTSESFELNIPAKVSSGTHILQIRVIDEAGNIASFSQEIVTK